MGGYATLMRQPNKRQRQWQWHNRQLVIKRWLRRLCHLLNKNLSAANSPHSSDLQYKRHKSPTQRDYHIMKVKRHARTGTKETFKVELIKNSYFFFVEFFFYIGFYDHLFTEPGKEEPMPRAKQCISQHTTCQGAYRDDHMRRIQIGFCI